jgi:hypothetical protein
MRVLIDLTLFAVLVVVTFGTAVGVIWTLGETLDIDWRAWLVFANLAIIVGPPAFRNMRWTIHAVDTVTVRARFWAGVRLFALLMFSALVSIPYLAPNLSGMFVVYIVPALISGGLFWWGTCLLRCYRRRGEDQKWFARRDEAKASEFAAWFEGQPSEDLKRVEQRQSVGA